MMQVRKGLVVATALASMAAGAVGAWIFMPTSGGAATTSTTTPTTPGSGSSGSNGNPSHCHHMNGSAPSSSTSSANTSSDGAQFPMP